MYRKCIITGMSRLRYNFYEEKNKKGIKIERVLDKK